MHQAIITKFLPVTNFRESRVKATAEAGSITLPWDHAKNVDQNHCAVARALASKYKWTGTWIGGAIPRPHSGYAFVMMDRKPRDGNDYFTINGEAQ